MSSCNNQEDFIAPWDDFSSTQLESVEKFSINKKNSIQNNNVDKINLLISSKTSLDVFLDELLDLPTKTKPKLRAPLSDISNRPQKHKSSSKEKEQKIKYIPVSTRMDSSDDSIWNEIDNDLLSLIDVDSKKDNSLQQKKSATPITIVKPSYDDMFKLKNQGNEITSPIPSYDDMFLPLSFKYKPLPPPSIYQPESLESSLSASNDHDELSNISEPKVESTTLNSSPPSISIDESLFLPQVTEDGHIIKELPTPTGPEAGFQSAKLINSKFTKKDIQREESRHQKEVNSSELTKPTIISEKSSIQNIPLKSSFSTASGKKLQGPSAKGKQKAFDLFDEPQINYDDIIKQYGGFQTGNKKKSFDISSQAKRKAISILIQPEAENDTPSKDVYTIDSNTNISPKSEEKFKSTVFPKKYLLEEEDTVVHKRQKTVISKALNAEVQKSSFTTASGKKLKEPSSEGMQKAISLLKDSQDPVKHADIIHQFGGFQTGNSKKSFDISSQAKRKAISVFDESEVETGNKHIRLSPEIIPNVIAKSSSKVPEQVDDKKLQIEKSSTKSVTSSNDALKKDNSTFSGNKLSLFPKRNNGRATITKRQNKPFKSPIIPSNIELTKAAVNNRSLSKAKLTPVFNLEAPDFRFKLRTLGKPGEFSKSELLANNIPISIINMTSSTSKKYLFNGNWGPKEARNEMIQAGALPRRTTIEWVENHYGWIVWKIACLIRSYNEFMDRWKPQSILEQLLYRYEREINMGNRPVLRRILEKDDLPMKHMILMISDIIEIKSALQYNTSSKYRIQLSDGWYQVPACIDLRIEKAIIQKKLKIGSKISICGTTIIGDKEGIHPLENTDNSTMLSITANSSLPARWHTKLGYHPRKLIIRKLPTIFDDGGVVTAIDIVVCRKFPILYSETLPNGSIITRNAKEEDEARRLVMGYDNYGVRKPINNNEVERRVSGFFKIRICDHISTFDQPWATLLLSNANELNHMDISEGNRYKIFFVTPYHPKNKKYPGLDLKTTRVTRWEPANTLNLLNSYKSRSLTKCDSIHFQDLSSDFDLVVLVLQTGSSTLENLNGRKLWKQTLLVTDESQSICQINFRLPINPFPDIKGQVLGLLNLRYETYDSKFDITCLKATDESESVSKISSAAEHIQKGMLDLKRWVNENPSKVQRMHDRVQNIVQ